ncbi:MAG: hypothetical protein R2748_21100 [Bryobacterales bacterium]
MVGGDEDADDLVDGGGAVALEHVDEWLEVDAGRAFLGVDEGPGVGVSCAEADVVGGYAGELGGAGDGVLEAVDEEAVDVDHGEFFTAGFEHQRGGQHFRGVSASRR